jgi:hypothetical protein
VAAALTSQTGTANATKASRTIKDFFTVLIDAQRLIGPLLVVREVLRGRIVRIQGSYEAVRNDSASVLHYLLIFATKNLPIYGRLLAKALYSRGFSRPRKKN